MPKKLVWIDALRAVAILLVIAVHARLHCQGLYTHLSYAASLGQWGVQLFFVVSAMTLCLSATSRKGEEYPLVHFFSRRFFRIAPAYWCGIFVYMFWSLFKNYLSTGQPVLGAAYTLPNVLSNFLFLNGLYPPGNNNVVPGGWSIGTEMLFYLLFPLLWMIQQKLSLKRLWLLPACSIFLSAAVVGLSTVVAKTPLVNNEFLYYSIANQLNVFVAGICAFRWLGQETRKSPLLAAFVILSVVGILLFRIEWGIVFYFLPIIFGTAFAALALYLSRVRQDGVLKYLAPIGKVSFSMYLLHFVILDGLEMLFQRVHPTLLQGNLSLFVLYLLTVPVTFGFASLSYKWIEKPGMMLGKALTNKILFHFRSTAGPGISRQNIE